MLTSIRGLMAATMLAGTLFAAAPAMAQDDPAVSFSGSATIASEYRFRGVDYSGGDIAVQGSINAALPAGFYVGTWGSSLDEDTVGYGHTELDIYGGWTGDVGGVTLDAGVIGYLYPNAGAGEFDYFEGYASVAGSLGPASVKVGIAYAPVQQSLGDGDNLYLYTDLGFGIPETPLSLAAHLGYTEGFATFTNDSKAFDWSIGGKLAIGDTLSVGVSYVGAEGDYAPGDYNFTEDAVVATLTASF